MDYSHLSVCHWTEANQGLLASVALGITLIFAIWEYIRANNQDIDTVKKCQMSALTALETYKKDINDALSKTAESSNIDNWDVLCERAAYLSEIIALIIQSNPQSLNLKIELLKTSKLLKSLGNIAYVGIEKQKWEKPLQDLSEHIENIKSLH